MTLENINKNWQKLYAYLKVISAFVKEHEISKENFFLGNDKILYCKNCNLPMEKMMEALAFRCWGCDATLTEKSYRELLL